jgi:hypothetical protein
MIDISTSKWLMPGNGSGKTHLAITKPRLFFNIFVKPDRKMCESAEKVADSCAIKTSEILGF